MRRMPRRIVCIVLTIMVVAAGLPITSLADDIQTEMTSEEMENPNIKDEEEDKNKRNTEEQIENDEGAEGTEQEETIEDNEVSVEKVLPETNVVNEEENITESVQNVDGKDTGNYQYTINNNTITITGYTGESSIVIVPESIEGCPVEIIGASAFSGCTGLAEVEMPKGLKKINEGAFSGCTGLTRVEIPENVTEIGAFAFSGCTGLTRVEVPGNVTEIGDYAFLGCSKLGEVVLNEGLKKIGSGFIENTVVSELTIPNTVTEMSYAVEGVESLKKVSFEQGIKTIPYDALGYYYSSNSRVYVEEVVLPESVTAIGSSAFSGCDKLKRIDFPEGMEEIGDFAFSGCTGLTRVEVPGNVTEIGDYAFSGCTGLTRVEIPENVTEIGASAFSGCSKLGEVVLNEGLKKIGSDFISNTVVSELTIPNTVTEMSYAVGGIESLKKVSFEQGIKTIPYGALSNYYDKVYVEEVVLPESVTAIGSSAFSGCDKLKRIDFPEGMEEIGSSAFSGCTGLAEVEIPKGLKKINGGTFSGCTGLTRVEIPENVTEIGDDAFLGCSKLGEVVLNEGLKKIGQYAFSGCMGLAKVEIPKGIKEISVSAFRDCTGLTRVEIPGNVTEIGVCAFSRCSKLGEVVLNEGLKKINEGAFSGCTGLTRVEIPGNVTEIGENAFSGCSKLGEIVLNEGLKKIGRGFIKNTAVSGLTIPNTVTEMSYAVEGVESLKKISFGQGIKTIPYEALSNQVYVEEVVLPESVTAIDSLAFSGCEKLKRIDFPEGMEEIGYGAFSGCTGLTRVEIPGNVIEIGAWAFSGCSKLGEVVLNEGLKKIGSDFIKNTAVSELTIPNTVTEMSYAVEGVESLKKVSFGQGIKIIPYGALSNYYDKVYVEEVVLPDSVSKIDENAFDGFKGILKIASENSVAVIYAIDHEIAYEVNKSGIGTKGNDHLDRNKTFYHMALSTSTTSGYVNLSLHYAFKEKEQSSIDDSGITLKIKVPSATTLAPKSFKIDGRLFEANMDEKGYIMLPVEKKEGNIVFSLKVSNISYLLSYAQIEYSYSGEKKTETIGIVNMENGMLTLDVPDTTADTTFMIKGLTAPGQEVMIYLEGTKVATATASNTGLYSTALELSNPQEGEMYKIEAKTIAGEKEASAIAYTEYTQNAAEVTECTMYYRGNTYDLLALEGKRPIISWANGTIFTFKVAFSNYRNIGEVYIVSTKNGEERRLEAFWNEEKQAYIAAGFAGYVPGSISVAYGEGLGTGFKDTSAIIETVYDRSEGIGYESKIIMGDGTDFFYTIEQKENIADLPEENLERIEDEGKICYLSQDVYYLTKENKTYAYQDLYIPDGNGRYSLLKTGIALETSKIATKSSISRVYTAKESDPVVERLKELKALLDFLRDTTEDIKETEIYVSLEKTLNTMQDSFNSSDPEYLEIANLKARLQVAKMTDGTKHAYNKINKIISNSVKYSQDPDILFEDDIAEKMQESVDTMKEVSQRIANKHLQSIMDELCAKGWFQKSLMEKTIQKLSEDMNSSLSFHAKYAIDPSGYVYEAVTNNKIEGVKASIYYKDPETGEALLWNAEEYDQTNPLYTGKDGEYAWDVPEGEWQVKYEKDGYETAFSEWLPVPPPHLEVNIGLQSKAKPIIESFALYPTHAKITFSKYMLPESLSGLRILDNNKNEVPYNLEYDKTQQNIDGVNYAREFILHYENNIVMEKGTRCKVVTSGKEQSYAGVFMDASEQENVVDTYTELVVPNSVKVKMGETIDIPIYIVNGDKTTSISAISAFEEIATVEHADVGKILIRGQMFGETEVILSIPEQGIQKTIKVTVGQATEEAELKQSVILPQETYVISVGESIEISPVILPDSSRKGKWAISDETILSIEDNHFTAKKEGESILRYTLLDDEKIYAECKIIVKDKRIRGDVSGDGHVNIEDLRIILRYVCGKTELTKDQLQTVDVEPDGKVDIRDLRKVLRFVCGKINEL